MAKFDISKTEKKKLKSKAKYIFLCDLLYWATIASSPDNEFIHSCKDFFYNRKFLTDLQIKALLNSNIVVFTQHVEDSFQRMKLSYHTWQDLEK